MTAWPDVEIELVTYLDGLLDGVRLCTELPADLADVMPLVQIQRVGGDDDGARLDRALVDADSFAGTRQAAADLSRAVHDALVLQLRGSMTAGAVFGRVSTVSAPAWRPYENTAGRRIGATYELFFHSRSVS